jgi:hypothetical protein
VYESVLLEESKGFIGRKWQFGTTSGECLDDNWFS